MEKQVKQSGVKDTFSTGAQRDSQKGKSRPDLISPFALDRIGQINRMGAEHYGDRNWEKGMSFSRVMASAERHRVAYLQGHTDEDHLAQWGWNVLALLHFDEGIKQGFLSTSLNDLPLYLDRAKPKFGGVNVEYIMEMDKKQNEAIQALGWSKQDHALLHTPRDSGLGMTATEFNATQPTRRTFYVAGPMRGKPKFNFPAFDAARDLGNRLGHIIISPADMDRDSGFSENNPPESATGPEMARKFCERDVKALLCLRAENNDGIALLPGWEKSTGAVAELFIARWLGLKVVDANTFYPFTQNILDCLMLAPLLNAVRGFLGDSRT